MKTMHYTRRELDEFALADLQADAQHAERQASDGPFYPERGITRESLLAYAAKCRKALGELSDKPEGTAHNAVLHGQF